jgi:hypothetical protein
VLLGGILVEEWVLISSHDSSQLGSALAAHILSNQPTQMPPIADLPKVVKDDTKTQFIL